MGKVSFLIKRVQKLELRKNEVETVEMERVRLGGEDTGREMRRFRGAGGSEEKIENRISGQIGLPRLLPRFSSTLCNPIAHKAVGYHHRVLNYTPPRMGIKSFTCQLDVA